MLLYLAEMLLRWLLSFCDFLKIMLQMSISLHSFFLIFDEWEFSLDERSFYSDKRKSTIEKRARKTWQ